MRALRVRSLLVDDGVGGLARRRRAVALRTWVDRVSGMVCYRGELDPERGSRFLGRLDAKVAELFHDRLPETVPSDPVARRDHLRGLHWWR